MSKKMYLACNVENPEKAYVVRENNIEKATKMLYKKELDNEDAFFKLIDYYFVKFHTDESGYLFDGIDEDEVDEFYQIWWYDAWKLLEKNTEIFFKDYPEWAEIYSIGCSNFETPREHLEYAVDMWVYMYQEAFGHEWIIKEIQSPILQEPNVVNL